MRNIWIFFAMVIVFLILLSSCRAHRPLCPAYGEAIIEMPQHQQENDIKPLT